MKRPNEKIDNVFSALVKSHMQELSNNRIATNQLNESFDMHDDDNDTIIDAEVIDIPVVKQHKITKSNKKRQVNRNSESFNLDMLIDKIQNNKVTAAIRLTTENLDGIIDDNDDLVDEFYDSLRNLSSDELIDYIRILLIALRNSN